MANKEHKKVGIYVAHDDDAILGIGGRMIQHIQQGDDVYLVTFTNGEYSHKFWLTKIFCGSAKGLAISEVEEKRLLEFKKALSIIGLPQNRYYFLNLPDRGGRKWSKARDVQDKILSVTNQERPDIIYFHYPEWSGDHVAVNRLMSLILEKLDWDLSAYHFIFETGLWKRRLLKIIMPFSRSLRAKIIKINVHEQLPVKRQALFEMKSQNSIWSYPDWPIQRWPILPPFFLKKYLRRDHEIIIPISKKLVQ